ncbi:MAG: Holliday junction resolvase RuvX [Chloroflexi bacterium]|nr:MAG: Holliday junction resolvase RuvX [Chloroflexota bacterium]
MQTPTGRAAGAGGSLGLMRWLAVDAGTVRVGLAICDPEERLAVPLEIVSASAAYPAIRAIATREAVEGIVMGLPLHMGGGEGDSAAMARRLGERIAKGLGLPVEYEDERLTSSEAERLGGAKKPSDDLAAALILEQFLARRRSDARDAGRA